LELPVPVIVNPSGTTEKKPQKTKALPRWSSPEPVYEPSPATIVWPLDQKDAPEPEAKVLKFHVPAKSERVPEHNVAYQAVWSTKL
ncbi:MAG: hypothetical protein ABSG91_17855, partial [Syntrophobacteraceae bacterium]